MDWLSSEYNSGRRSLKSFCPYLALIIYLGCRALEGFILNASQITLTNMRTGSLV